MKIFEKVLRMWKKWYIHTDLHKINRAGLNFWPETT